MRRPRPIHRLVVLLVATLLAGCAGVGNAGLRAAHAPTHPRPPSLTDQVLRTAQSFMDLLVSGRYDAQWTLLAPQAQQQWPSQAARTQMLQQKFGGLRLGYQLGAPSPGATWTSGEDLATLSGLWRVPVALQLTSPGAIRPPDATALYQQLDLYLSVPRRSAAGRVEVVGEGPASLDAPVLLPPSAPPRSATVPILMYHEVAPYPNPSQFPSAYDYRLEYGLTVSPDEFQGQMAWLADHGYQPISLVRLADYLSYGLPLPPHPIVLTFDDGLESQFQYAVPVLHQHAFTAEFFIPTGLVGWHGKTRWYMSWDQIDQLAQEGFWVEDHTQNHVEVYGLSPADLQTQLVVSRQALQHQTGQAIQFFAYPGAWPFPSAETAGPAQRSVFSALADAGYVLALTDPGIGADLVRSDLPFQLPRIRVGPEEALSSFIASLSPH
ncbi:MAG TPA: polysaccharide deacetylase family protein [Candidatus Dormibacteraeota bacterium]|nr:polysaccharide deacetylase family protein [Candidatus Dormibacteraeota bacterium]